MREFYERHHTHLHLLVLTLACFAVFSNNFDHVYHLDSGHVIRDNLYVRSLKHIPRYFTDATTMSTYRPNVGYRPVLMTTYALNHAISGYHTWSWHLLQILLHAVCVISLYFFSRRAIREFTDATENAATASIPFLVAALFAVHPSTSGVINYLSARSSLLVAALILPSLVLYMRSRDAGEEGKTPWTSCVLYTLALFTKEEAVTALAVYFLYDVLRTAKSGCPRGVDPTQRPSGSLSFVRDVMRTCNRSTLRRLGPFIAVMILYLAVWATVTPDYLEGARYQAGVTPFIYLLTQLTTWWHYVARWFAPVHLVADNMTYPVFRSILAPQVLLALSGWLLVATFLIARYRKEPQLMFIVVSALALVSASSSVVPLAEMVNEHRPYLPLAILSTVWLIPGLLAMFRCAQSRVVIRGLVVTGLTIWLTSLSVMTYERNTAFSTNEAYNEDIISKAPSPRAYNNYALTLMRKASYGEALTYLEKGLALAPNWHILHVNAGITHHARGDNARALYHFNRAVESEQLSGLGLMHRGEFYLDNKQYELALKDFRDSIPRSVRYYRIYKGIATAYAGMGQWSEAVSYTSKCHEIDAARTELDIVGISSGFWGGPDLYEHGIEYYRALERVFPERWWVHHNIGTLAAKVGQRQLARTSLARSRELRGSEPS